jgi:sarcosine oxidase subunit alpha
MTRDALMLDEAGVAIDDGVVGRLAAESCYVTTTTGNSATLFASSVVWPPGGGCPWAS